MRLPVSTTCNKFLCRRMLGRVVCGAVLPGSPEDSQPGASEYADGVGVIAASFASFAVDKGCPRACVPGVIGEAGDGGPQPLVAGPPPSDAARLAALVSNWGDAGLGGEVVLGLEAGAHVAKFGGDLSGANLAGSRKGHHNAAFGQLGDGVLDAAGELGDLGDDGFERSGKGFHELALGFGLRFSGKATSRRPQSGQHLGRSASTGILVLAKEGGHALLTEPHGAAGRRITVEKSKRDRACDVGEACDRSRPEAIEKGSELIGQDNLRGDKIVATSHQGTQGLYGVRLRTERRQPMAVGTQDIGQNIGIAWVALGGDGAISRPAGLYNIWMDRRDNEPGIDEAIDDEAAGALDGDRCSGRRPPSPKPSDEIGKSIKIMRYQEAFEDFTGAIEHADGVARSAPVETDENGHSVSLASRNIIPSAGSPCGALINRRSGQIFAEPPLAHLPVARHSLPATATPQVSCGPSRGKQLWRSSRRRGTDASSPLKLIQPRQREVA